MILPPDVSDPDYDKAVVVARLYSIVLGRGPDGSGLSTYISTAEDGDWHRHVAAALLDSAECRDRAGRIPVADRLCLNALGRPATAQERVTPLIDLAIDLAGRDEVMARFSGLGAFFPDGLPLDDVRLYRLWLQDLVDRRARKRGVIEARDGEPLLTVIIEVTVEALPALERSIRSLADQSLPSVQVVIAAGNDAVDPALAIARAHPRTAIHVVRATWPRSSSVRQLGKALRAARAEFTTLVRAGDLLDRHAIAELADASAGQAADVFLADVDHIDQEGRFSEPSLGAGWDPDAALARPPSGLVIVRTTLLRQCGGFRDEALDEQEWDILLRAAAQLGGRRIAHIPAILRHSVPRRPVDDWACADPGQAIVRLYLDQTAQPGRRIDGSGRSEPIRVIHPLPAIPPLATVIIPTRDRADLLGPCVNGLLDRTRYPAMDVLIVDNDSQDEATRQLFGQLLKNPQVRILTMAGAFNWSAVNNAAIRAMRGEVAVLLNNDTDVIDPDWLREMVSQAIRPDVGVVGAKLLYRDRSVQHAGIALGPGCCAVHVWRYEDGLAGGYLDQLRIVRTVAAVTGACLAIRRDVWEQVGGIEEQNLKVTWSDADLCLRVRTAGYRVVWTPHALLYHLELQSRGSDDGPATWPRFLAEHAYFKHTWTGRADHDPYRSPHLAPTQNGRHLAVEAG